MSVFGAALTSSVVALAVAWAVVTATFLLARRRARYDLIDSVWGAGFAVIAVVTFALSWVANGGAGGVAVVITLLTVVWGARLSVHIHRRNHGRSEDPRYVEMAARATGDPAVRMYFRVYLTQALVMWFVSLPVQFAQLGPAPGRFATLGVLSGVGGVVWAVGFVFEAVGDEQLRRFKADPMNAGRVLDTGLWRYTRHPNYFGDACVWWGLYLLACHHVWGVVTILSPVVMTLLLAAGTGKPLLERAMREKRPDYAAYVDRTSGFFPLPPRKSW